MERSYGVRLNVDGVVVDFDVIGLAVNPYRKEEDLNKFYERNATTKGLPVYISTNIKEGCVRLLLGKTFVDVNVKD